jgi:hypothetical protein
LEANRDRGFCNRIPAEVRSLRLWALHPKYLDAKGLVALWREGLLALHVLRGTTRGYRRHPQLDRFRRTEDPVGALNRFLWYVHGRGVSRGYRFDESKLGPRAGAGNFPSPPDSSSTSWPISGRSSLPGIPKGAGGSYGLDRRIRIRFSSSFPGGSRIGKETL